MSYIRSFEDVFDFPFAKNKEIKVYPVTHIWTEFEECGGAYCSREFKELVEISFIVDGKGYTEKQLLEAAPAMMAAFITSLKEDVTR
jgi:hypothetical protein